MNKQDHSLKIMVDHGAFGNLGDTAMIEGVVGRLLAAAPELEAFVIDRPQLRTQIWDWPRVHRVSFNIISPTWGALIMRLVRSTPYFWRFSKASVIQQLDLRLNPWVIARRFPRLGQTLDPQRIRVCSHGSDMLMGDWCQNFHGYHIVGGGNLTDLFPAEVWRRCCLMAAFRAQRKPVVLTGQQIGPWSLSAMRETCARLLREVSYCGLREPNDSLDFCRDAGLAENRYAVMGDDSFGLACVSESELAPLIAKYDLKPQGFLAVNLRIGYYARGQKRFFENMKTLLAQLAERYRIPIVVVPIALHDVDSDIRSGHYLAELVGRDLVRVIDEPDLTPGQAKTLLGQARAAVGVSYHFCTFALSQGVPAVCLHDGAYYSQKGRGLADFWEDERLAVPLGQVDPALGLQRVIDVIEDQPFRELLRDRANRKVAEWQHIFDQVVHEHYRLDHAAAGELTNG